MKNSISLVLSILIAGVAYLGIKAGLENTTISATGETLMFVFKGTVPEDDIFRMNIQLEGQERPVYRADTLTGSDSPQEVVFELPKRQLSSVRFSLGLNKEQKTITFDEIRLVHGANTLIIPPDSIEENFRVNRFITLSEDKTEWTPIADKGRYVPYLQAKNTFFDNINALLEQPLPLPYTGPIALILALVTGIALYAAFRRNPLALRAVRWYQVAMVVLFLFIIIAPYLDERYELDSTAQNMENRTRAESFSTENIHLEDIPARFSAYYGDAFGFRDRLVDWGAKSKYRFFHSASNDRVVIGKDDWVFIGNHFQLFEDYTRQNLYTQEELEAKAQELVDRKATLLSDSISYYHTYYPNKHTIYQDQLPDRFRGLRRDTVSRPDQLITYMSEAHPDFEIIDVRPALYAAKKDQQIYYKVDSHWNMQGAFFAYRRLFSRIAEDYPELAPRPMRDFRVTWEQIGHGGHFNLLGIQDMDFLPDSIPTYEPREWAPDIQVSYEPGNYPEKTEIHINMDNRDGLVALVFRDSFTNNLTPFISPHFKQVVYIWKKYDPKYVKWVNPDVVIVGYVERYFE